MTDVEKRLLQAAAEDVFGKSADKLLAEVDSPLPDDRVHDWRDHVHLNVRDVWDELPRIARVVGLLGALSKESRDSMAEDI